MPEEPQEKFIIKWNEKSDSFVPVKSEEDMKEGVFLEFQPEEKSWKYFYISGASLIARRTALRSANGISKTGYVHPETGIRYGSEFKLIEEKSPYEDMPDKLRASQRSWYEHKKSQNPES